VRVVCARVLFVYVWGGVSARARICILQAKSLKTFKKLIFVELLIQMSITIIVFLNNNSLDLITDTRSLLCVVATLVTQKR